MFLLLILLVKYSKRLLIKIWLKTSITIRLRLYAITSGMIVWLWVDIIVRFQTKRYFTNLSMSFKYANMLNLPTLGAVRFARILAVAVGVSVV